MRETHSDNIYKPGSYWKECDVCGFDYRIEDLKVRWDGALVCKADWEPRHPRDYPRPVGRDTYGVDNRRS